MAQKAIALSREKTSFMIKLKEAAEEIGVPEDWWLNLKNIPHRITPKTDILYTEPHISNRGFVALKELLSFKLTPEEASKLWGTSSDEVNLLMVRFFRAKRGEDEPRKTKKKPVSKPKLPKKQKATITCAMDIYRLYARHRKSILMYMELNKTIKPKESEKSRTAFDSIHDPKGIKTLLSEIPKDKDEIPHIYHAINNYGNLFSHSEFFKTVKAVYTRYPEFREAIYKYIPKPAPKEKFGILNAITYDYILRYLKHQEQQLITIAKKGRLFITYDEKCYIAKYQIIENIIHTKKQLKVNQTAFKERKSPYEISTSFHNNPPTILEKITIEREKREIFKNQAIFKSTTLSFKEFMETPDSLSEEVINTQ